MSNQPFRLILPDQKRLRAAFDAVMDQAGFAFAKPTPRAASGFTIDKTGLLPPLETYEFRSEAALEWLAEDAGDLAIVGEDAFREMQAKGSFTSEESVAPRPLLTMDRISACSMWIAATPARAIKNLQDLESLRIATSYPGLLQQILENQGVKPGKIIAQKGGVESTITAGRADAILEIVQTGESLKQNGLEKKIQLFNSCALLMRSPRPQNAERESLAQAFTSRIARALDAAALDSKIIRAQTTPLAANAAVSTAQPARTPSLTLDA